MDPTIIKHLANLKFYSNFKKKEKAKSFDQYVEFIDSGAPENFKWKPEGTKVIEKFKFDDPFYGDIVDSEKEEAIENFFKQNKNEEPKLNLDDWYNEVEYHIDYLLKRYEEKIIVRKEPFKVLNEILNEFPLVKKYISIREEDFYTYTNRMQQRAPEDFITNFSKKNKIEDYSLIDCYPRIFINCKSYSLFVELKKEIENPSADYSFIFYKMRGDKLIHFYCKDEYLELINKDSNSLIEIYPESKIKSSKFKSKYSRIYQNMY